MSDPGSTTLLLSRHGRTAWSVQGRYTGSSDVPLDEKGRAQAVELTAWSAGAALDAVWSSPLVRARETSAGAAAAAGVPLRLDDRLRELDFGRGEGLTKAEMRAAFADDVRRFEIDPAACPLPGGEDPRAAVARVSEALREAAAEHPGGRVLVVAHNTILRLALCKLLGIPLREYRRRLPAIAHGAITELQVGSRAVGLVALNVPLAKVRAPSAYDPR